MMPSMTNDSQNCLIYIVDDDEGVRDSLSWLLEGRGYRTQCFSSAENFNSNGDNSMTKVYKMVNFNDTPDKNIKPTKVKQAKSLTKPKQEKIVPEKELNKTPGPLPNKQIKQTDIETFKQNLDKNLNIQKEKDEITKEMETDNNDLKSGPKETTIEK